MRRRTLMQLAGLVPTRQQRLERRAAVAAERHKLRMAELARIAERLRPETSVNQNYPLDAKKDRE